MAAEIVENFDGYSQGADLDTTANWVCTQEFGTGVMRIDEHDDHSNGSKVVDMSTTGGQIGIHVTSLSNVDHYAQCDAFIDTFATSGNAIGPMVRCNQTAFNGSFTGYGGFFIQDFDGTTVGRIYRFDGTTFVELAESGNLDNTAYADRDTMREVVLTITSDDLALSIGGTQVVTFTDSTYSTGSLSGVYQARATSLADSQPFFDDFEAGTFGVAGQPPFWGIRMR